MRSTKLSNTDNVETNLSTKTNKITEVGITISHC